MDATAAVLWAARDTALVPHAAWHRASEAPAAPDPGLAAEARRRCAPHARGGSVAVPAIHGGDVLAVVELASCEEDEPQALLMRSFTGIGHELGRFLAGRRGELEASLLTVREREVLQLAAGGHSRARDRRTARGQPGHRPDASREPLPGSLERPTARRRSPRHCVAA